jgi:hypothetical protein
MTRRAVSRKASLEVGKREWLMMESPGREFIERTWAGSPG